MIKDWRNMGNLQQWYDPIDTTNPRLIKLAKELGTAWVRVSGTWANKTYYDFDGKCNGKVPEGFQMYLSNMILLADDQRHRTVDTGTRIPAAVGFQRIVYLHPNCVAARLHEIGNIYIKSGVSVSMRVS